MASSQDINTFIKEFPSYYQKQIAPILAGFEQERIAKKQQHKILVWSFAILLLVCIAVIFLFNKTNNSLTLSIVVPGFILCFVLIFSAVRISSGFIKKVKTAALGKFLSFFGDFCWGLEDKLSRAEMVKAKLFKEIDTFKTDDNFEGSFKGQKIVISEVTLGVHRKKMCNGEEKIKLVEVFKGVVAKISLNKKFTTQTVIASGHEFIEEIEDGSNVLLNSIVSSIENQSLTIRNKGTTVAEFYKKHKLEAVELEDIEFNKIFNVYAQDQVEARYLLTPSFMERFKLLMKVYETGGIRASFVDGSLIIAIPCQKDMFALGELDKPLTDSAQMHAFFKEFVSILSLVDILKLDSKIGL